MVVMEIQADIDPSKALSSYTLRIAQLSGAFVHAFSDACNHEFKSEIADAVDSEAVQQLFESVELEEAVLRRAHLIFRTSSPLQPWLLAPEDGLRALLRACLRLYEPSLRHVLDAAKKATTAAVQAAAQKGFMTDEVLRDLLLDQALKVIHSWHDETWGQLYRNLHAEAEFPNPERFVVLRQRLQQLIAEASLRQSQQRVTDLKRKLEQATARFQQQSLLTNPLIANISKTAIACGGEQPPAPASWKEYYMGWLEKRNRRGLWQKRWVVISLLQQRLWYFGAPEEQNARGAADLGRAQLLDEGHPRVVRLIFPDAYAAVPAARTAAATTATPTTSVESDSRQNNNRRSTKAGLTGLALRAATLASAVQWKDMLSKAIEGVRELDPGAISPIDGEQRGGGSPVERKISTQVFKDEDTVNVGKASAGTGTGASTSSKTSTARKASVLLISSSKPLGAHRLDDDDRVQDEGISLKDDESTASSESDANEAKQREAEERLFAEITQQAEQATPSADEVQVLECCAQAVREYMADAQAKLTEQAVRVILDGMLPVGRRQEEMRAALLQVLVPASSAHEAEEKRIANRRG